MTIHGPATITDELAEQLAGQLAQPSSTGEITPHVVSVAITATCHSLGIVAGDVYPVVSDAISMLLHHDDQRTVAIHVTPAEARDLLQAMDTLDDANPDDAEVHALWQRTENAAVRLGVATPRST